MWILATISLSDSNYLFYRIFNIGFLSLSNIGTGKTSMGSGLTEQICLVLFLVDQFDKKKLRPGRPTIKLESELEKRSFEFESHKEALPRIKYMSYLHCTIYFSELGVRVLDSFGNAHLHSVTHIHHT